MVNGYDSAEDKVAHIGIATQKAIDDSRPIGLQFTVDLIVDMYARALTRAIGLESIALDAASVIEDEALREATRAAIAETLIRFPLPGELDER